MDIDRYVVYSNMGLIAVFDKKEQRQLKEEEIQKLEEEYISKRKRYVSTITVYNYGLTPEFAFSEASKMCSILNDKFDCRASVEQMHEQPSGTLSSTKININKFK